mgnify:FL=1
MKERKQLSIKDNPKLNQLINGNRNGKGGFNKPKYCRRCGKNIIYTTKNKNGNLNQTMEWEWNHRVCHECFQKYINDPDSKIYKEYYGIENNSKKGDDDSRRKL